MKGCKYILLTLCALIFLPAYAQKKEKIGLTVEQEQQFSYYWYAARQALENHDIPQALVLFEFCDAIKPNDGQTLSFLAFLYNGMGQTERALETYKKAFEADPRDHWYRYASALLERKTEEAQTEAMRVMERALKVNPKDENLLEMLARQYGAEEQWKKALSMQDRLDAIRGYNFFSAVNRYRVYVYWGKYKKAIEAIDKYLEQDPTNLQFMLFKLELMEHTKVKAADLYALYEQILEIVPTNCSVLNNYAYHLATHKGDLQKAERMSAVTIREEPDNSVYLDTYGWILHLKGQDELAKFYLNRALINATNEATEKEIKKHLNAIK